MNFKGRALAQSPSIIIVLIIPNRVSEALGLTRNNSECFFAVSGFLPEPSAKVRQFFEILYIDDEIVFRWESFLLKRPLRLKNGGVV